MLSVCDPASGDLAAAFYWFTLPASVQYRSMRLDTYGNTFYGPTRVRGTFLNTITNQADITAGARVSSHANAWYNVGSIDPAGHVDSRRTVDSAVFVTTETGYISDFDIGQVRLIVSYAVLV